jgi:hypothetical protein
MNPGFFIPLQKPLRICIVRAILKRTARETERADSGNDGLGICLVFLEGGSIVGWFFAHNPLKLFPNFVRFEAELIAHREETNAQGV